MTDDKAETPQIPPVPDMPPGIRLRNLTVRVGGTDLIEGLSHTFEAGQWTCILGPSGIGKTMLLRTLLGLNSENPNRDVSWTGVVETTTGGQIAGQTAYMAQQDLLYPWMSVRGNVELGNRLRRTPNAGEPATTELLEAVGLWDYRDALPAALSGGMRQRAALARTLKENRAVVFMDEPFSAVDAITRSRLQDMAAACLRGRTVIMITHDPLEALRLGDKVLVLSGQPATFTKAIEPSGDVPRNLENTEILAMQGALLAELKAALP